MVIPSPTVPGSPTAAKKLTIIKWIKNDAQAKARTGTAKEQWTTLTTHYAHLNISSQFELHAQLFVEKLKDVDDTSHYISTFKNVRRHFAEIGVIVTEDEMVFLLLHGLPSTPEWIIFKHMTMNLYSSSSIPTAPSSSSTTTTVTKMTFAAIVSSLSEEANRL
ncbi:hypothetical protein BDR06DRAFT_1006377 [Suillus hirtellus]|nr:hypothetical protein BDR06DRAFT_1006377 [Suillus hirtellus]